MQLDLLLFAVIWAAIVYGINRGALRELGYTQLLRPASATMQFIGYFICALFPLVVLPGIVWPRLFISKQRGTSLTARELPQASLRRIRFACSAYFAVLITIITIRTILGTFR